MFRSISLVTALLCALSFASRATAGDVSLSLNLKFTFLGDLNSGGTWTVVAKAEDRGIAGVVMRFLDSSLNFIFDPNASFFLSDVFEVQESAIFGLELELVQGEDPDFGRTLDVGVIGGTFPSGYVDDPDLVPLGANPDLGSFTGGVELVTGTFDPGDIPEWTQASANLYSSAAGPIVAADNVFLTVRYLVPEPATLALLGTGAVGVIFVRRRS